LGWRRPVAASRRWNPRTRLLACNLLEGVLCKS
jgi:hypothetical protein